MFSKDEDKEKPEVTFIEIPCLECGRLLIAFDTDEVFYVLCITCKKQFPVRITERSEPEPEG